MAKEASRSDQFDAPWKVAVERFLEPLLQLCFPAVHDAIDWRHPPEFLDTELEALGPDHHHGSRTVDKLVKVRRLDGADQWLFLHIEIQAQPTAHFPDRMWLALATQRDPWARYEGRFRLARHLRMWVYYYRLYGKYGPAVVSLAILADADPRWRPHTCETEIAGCGLRFEFPVFKVLDFDKAEATSSWKHFEALGWATRNPRQPDRVQVAAGGGYAPPDKGFGWRHLPLIMLLLSG